MYLIRQLMYLRYHDGTRMADHVNAFQGIINQLSSMSITFDDEVRALLLLGSLPNTWETLKITLCNSAPDGKVTWDQVKAKVMNEETKRLVESPSSQSEMLVTESRGRSKRSVEGF